MIEIKNNYTWLVTGAAGFIGSHLVESLLSQNQNVVGLDNLATGHLENIDAALRESGGKNFSFIEGSITNLEICREAVKNCDFVLHHAALASVPESLSDPVQYNLVNAQGFMNILQASHENKIKRVVYASSSAVYGDDETLPKTESKIGKTLSPYAMTKYFNEVQAEFFTRVYKLETVGLRYFNVFGKRQDPNGAYAAVIPRWIEAVKSDKIPIIFGDGTATRDFCAVKNIVNANILAALSSEASGKVFNIGCGVKTSLNELVREIYSVFAPEREIKFIREAPRAGDILHSTASIEYAKKFLNFEPEIYLHEGLELMRK